MIYCKRPASHIFNLIIVSCRLSPGDRRGRYGAAFAVGPKEGSVLAASGAGAGVMRATRGAGIGVLLVAVGVVAA